MLLIIKYLLQFIFIEHFKLHLIIPFPDFILHFNFKVSLLRFPSFRFLLYINKYYLYYNENE